MADDAAQTQLHSAVHDVRVNQSARVTLQGQMLPTVGVTYYVGQHGPFTDSYDAATFDHVKAQQGILQRVHSIQQLDSTLPGEPVVKEEPIPPSVGVIGGPPHTVTPIFKVAPKLVAPHAPAHIR